MTPTSPISNAPSPAALRRQMQAARARLPGRVRRQAAALVARRVARLPAVRSARRVSAYLAVRGELDPAPLLAALAARGVALYLPVVRRDRLCFVRYRPGDPLRAGRYGIPVPVRCGAVGPRALQVVLAPLVAFDAAGHRLGSGGGYYDRTLAARNPPRRATRPRVIGIGYDFQRVAMLVSQAHDVALDAVVTPAGARVFRTPRR